MKPAANSPVQACATGSGGGRRFLSGACLHQALQVSMWITLATGIFHLLNLIELGRTGIGPAMFTFFRASIAVSWVLLTAGWISARRLPGLDRVDAVAAAAAAVFLFRGAVTPETFTTTLNLVVTGAGVFFLVRFGVGTRSDVRGVLAALTVIALGLCAYGLLEYYFTVNPLFDHIQVEHKIRVPLM